MDKSKAKKVPLPSASESEQQTVLEKETVEKILQVSGEEKFDTQSVHSESDNEGVSTIIESVDVVDKVINKVGDDVVKIISSNDADCKKLLETDIDKIGEEVIEILREKSVERDENLKISLDDATSKNIEGNVDTIEAEKSETEKIIEEKSEKIDDEKIIENLHEEKVEQSTAVEEKESSEKTVDEKIVSEEVEAPKVESEDKQKETLIDEDLLPKEAVASFNAEQNKPPVPIQTYLWEDIKRAKEQVSDDHGGYPWTHIYKRPLGENEEPEVILTYDRSPKSGRRSQPETPKSQKKVRIQDEVETCEEKIELPTEESKEEEEVQDETESQDTAVEETTDSLQAETASVDVKKSPKSILKKSQKLLDNIKPNTSKFDSDSLKRKIKSPLQKIKKMADQQISKVKAKSSIKKIPVGKDEIVLNEKVEILKLKESPKSHHRELPAFIVKQDSDDTIDIVELEQSPSENRKQRLIESGIVTPDEIINLPVSTVNNTQEPNSCKKSDNEESHDHDHKHNDKEMSPTTVSIHKRKEHIYEEIDDFVSKIAFDTEHVDRVTFEDDKNPHDANLSKQDNITDPMFDEFSREMNKKIRKSLTSQDDSIKRELVKRNPKIEELDKQISDDYKEEQIGDFDDIDVHIKNPRKLAPLSSVDSTRSHDEPDSTKKHVHKHSGKEMSPTTVIIHKKNENIYEEIDDFIAKIAFDPENVERVRCVDEKNPHDIDLEKHDNISDPIFDEFSREMNKQIRKSLSHDDSARQEIAKKIPKIKDLEKQLSIESTHSNHEPYVHKHDDKEMSPTTVIIHKRKESIVEEMDDVVARIASDSENVERVTYEEENPHDAELAKQDNVSDPMFDEFSCEMNRKIRKSFSHDHDDTIRQEIAKKIPKIKDLEKQMSTESTHSNHEPYVHKHDDKEMSPTAVIIHKRKESLVEEIDDVVARLASDSENVERVTYEEENPHDAEKQDNVSDPMFDEFSCEMNRKIRKSFSHDHDDTIRQEIAKKIPKIKDLEKQMSTESTHSNHEPYVHKHDDKEMSPTAVIIHNRKESIVEEIDDVVAKIAFDSENVERATYEEKNPHDAKLSKQDNVSDPMFDEFSRELNKKIRSSLNSQDDSIRQELIRRVPKIEELEKQLSDEDREVKIEEVDDIEVVMRSSHLLAPISSIDSTSSDEDRRAQLSIVAEESETSDSLIKKKSFETEPSVDIHDVESLKNDESDVSTLIDDVKVEVKSPKKEDESPEKDIREDVDIKDNEAPAPIKINPKWSKMSDHEYEPIGEPMLDENEPMDDSQSNDKQKRKNSDPLEQGNEKKLLRSPSDESEDNISAQDFQDQIENRFFRKEIEPISDNEDHVHEEDIFEEAVIIDEEPVAREVPKKKSFMESAQNSGKNIQKKISSIKTSLNNKIKKKPKEKPVAVEVAHVEKEEEPQVDENVVEEKEAVESITINVQEAEEEASKSKKSKMSKLTQNIKKPTMPKFNKPQFKKPQMPKMPDLKVAERFGNLRKLGRSKSMKETTKESSNGDSTSLNTPEVASAEPSTKKKFDFGTYPRLIRDKFKRPKLPERSDASMISESPAPDEDFNRVTQNFAQRGPVASRWPEYIEEESGKYQHFDSESDLDRDRMEFEREEVRHLMTDEQRQLDDMDRENFQIHLMAQQEKFRKPYIERQGSDVASEDDKLMWSGALNKNVKEDEEEFEQNALRFDEDYKFNLEAYNTQNLNRSSTPQTNQETQSSGSSGVRRRGGFLDDDDEYFLREQRVTNKVGAAGDYLDSAIKEGLGTSNDNALTQIGSYDDEIEADHHEMSPEKPTRSLKRKKKSKPQEPEDENIQNEQVAFDFYKTYPPHRPTRNKKSISMEPDEDVNFEQDIPDDSSDILDENEMGTFKGIEHPDLAYLQDDFDNELDFNAPQLPVPPTPPRRRKKKIHGLQPHGFMSLRNEHKQKPLPVEDDNEIIVYRQEHNFIPLAQEERYTTPTPTPRRTRSRSRSQVSAYTLDDAESFKKDSVDEFNNIIVHDNKENDYAVIKKETPPKAAVRRKRSTKSLGDKQFATLPLMPRRSDHELAPPRPPRNYSTIAHEKPAKPDKPPRRKSAGSLVEISKTIKDDDYEEILDTSAQESRLSQRLQSGHVINKMKDRPLPPPPRPKRENKKPRRDTNNDDDKFDNNEGGAERITEPLTVSIDTTEMTVEREPALLLESAQTEAIKEQPINDELKVDKYLPRQESDFSEPERPIEVEVSTQTDPLPYDEFAMDDEDEDVDIEEFIGSDGKIKTLEDILKEEQEAEIERARQLAEAENLSKGIQRFRETSQRSLSEHTRTSRSLSRPITPSAVVVERKKSSPIVFDRQEQMLTEAGLFIHPITYDDFGIPPIEGEQQPVEDHQPAVEQREELLDVNNNLQAELNARLEESLTSASPEPDYDEIIKQAQLKYGDDEGDDELDAEMQRKIEEMIESVMNTAREEAEWIKESRENVTEEKISNIPDEVIEEPITKVEKVAEESKPQPVTEIFDEAPPLPPPRRKSNIDESILRREFNIDEDFLTKEPPLPPVPTIPTEEKSETIEEPIETIEEPIEAIEEPIKTIEEPIEVIEEPIVVEQSIQTEEILTNGEPATEEADIDKVDDENDIGISVDIEQSETQEEIKEEPVNESRLVISQTVSEDRPSSPFPSRIHLASLEIDNLSVTSLQAGRITASEIDSNSIVTNEFEAKSTTLPGQTVQIELPPGLIDEIVERVRNADRAEMQLILAEQQKMVEEDRKYAEDQRIAELEQKMLEEQKTAELERKTLEEQKIKELERRLAEEQKIAELERRLAEEQKIAELERKLAEEQKIAELERKLAEEQRIADLERKLAEEQRIAELERKLAEEQRIAELERKLVEEHRIKELERKLAEERRIAELERRIAEEQRKIAEEKRFASNEPPMTQEVHKETEKIPETKSDEINPPERPPLPEDYHQTSSQIPQTFYQLRDFSEEDNKAPHHPTHHRRRKHQPKKKDSTSDDDYQKDQKDQRPRSRAGPSNDTSVASLGGQFLRACGNSLVDSGNQLMEILRASSKDENYHDLHVALIILIVIIAGLCLMGTGDKSVHHHHWDFFNPPENQGR
ncbi:titin isoform X2 [Chironomus tepperi]|uniref:titin isoform X2 n=1 Tax=Chironomus tepperi TaxID=113505 RepID=UPI00391F4575